MALSPPDLVRAFTDGAAYPVVGDGSCVVRLRDGGALAMPTGRLIAADPGLVFGDTEPFTVRLAPGIHTVTLSVAAITYGAAHHVERVAMAGLVVGLGVPERWELALLRGEDVSVLGPDEFYGYGVSSGFGCFMDAAALGPFTDLGDEPIDEFELLHESLDDSGCSWAEVELEECDANVVAFSSGWGEGTYPTWVGLGVDGDVVRVVTDFGVLGERAS